MLHAVRRARSSASARRLFGIVVGLVLALAGPPLLAQRAAAPALRGAITTQNGTVFLPGVTITVTASDKIVATTVTNERGEFAVATLAPGTYDVHAVLDGFAERISSVTVTATAPAELRLDLALAKMAETITVEGAKVPLTATDSLKTGNGESLEIGPIQGDNFQALLPTLPGVVRGSDGHISINGATATQSSVQVSAANVTDPSTGDLGYDLPNDAVESVEVLTNPYAAEYGRFSSGVTTLHTTHGGPSWSFTPNGFVPRLFRSQQNWWDIKGIRSFRPRFALGGPLVAGKVFLFETVLYRYVRNPIPGLPDDQTTRYSELKTFSRIDTNVSDRHLFYVTVATFPQHAQYAGLNTFNRTDVSTNFDQAGFNATATDHVVLKDARLFESTFAVKRYDVNVDPQGVADMVMTPDGNSGNFFNRQARQSTTFQWVGSLTLTALGKTGEHLIKIGSDLLQVAYNGSSWSRPVDVRREDGTLAERLTFGAMTTQHVQSTEAAALVQDHWRVSDRVSAELGARVDHDGVTARTNFTPRAGIVVGLLPDARTVLRGGVGLFYDRTPLNVGAFESFEPRTITEYAADGVTPLGAPVTYVNQAGTLQTPYSRIWNLELDHRITEAISVKVNHLERDGHDEFIVNPVLAPTPAIVLSSSGQSRYRETEFSARWQMGTRADTTVSYVRSHVEADLNAYDAFFGNARTPLIWPNQYSFAPVDTPNRFLIHGSYGLPWQVRFDPFIDLHTGFPLSNLAENQSYVGVRNAAGRFPFFRSFDFSASRPVKIWKYRATVGVRMFDAFNTFNPRDAQRNLASPAYGTFYSMIPRDFQTFVELGR